MEQVTKKILLKNKFYDFEKVINSFDKQINQMSTPLHHQPNDNTVKGNNRKKKLALLFQINFL